MFRKSQAFGLLALSALVFLAAGCGGSSNPSTVAVSGTLLYEDGKPVANASLRFVNAAGGRDANGHSGKDGAFNLTTFNNGDGAIPGEYTIVVTKIASSIDTSGVDTSKLTPDDMMKMTKGTVGSTGVAKKVEDPIPPIYSDIKSSPLKQKIDAATSTMTLKLKRS